MLLDYPLLKITICLVYQGLIKGSKSIIRYTFNNQVSSPSSIEMKQNFFIGYLYSNWGKKACKCFQNTHIFLFEEEPSFKNEKGTKKFLDYFYPAKNSPSIQISITPYSSWIVLLIITFCN